MPRKESNHAYLEYRQLPQLFELQAAQNPHATAVVFRERKITYLQLNQRSNQLASFLRSRGVGRSGLVGIGIDRAPAALIGILGVLKAGAAYVPLDPSYPKNRLACMLADCSAPVLLTASSVAGCFGGYGGTVLYLDRGWREIEREPAANPECRAGPADRAYVMYTSGSSGWPKGVQIAHGSVINAAQAMRTKLGMGANDVVLSVSSLSFDIHVLDLWMPLACGACMVIAPEAACRDGSELARELARVGATVMQATPSTWQLLLDSGWAGSRRLTAVCGGEAMSSELAARLRPKVKALWNAYGPTETTVWSSVYRVRGGEEIVPIGRPLANTHFHVLDEQRRLVPAGVAGELHIGGEGLALGYLNQSGLTSERFIIHPFDCAGSRRLYRTGDRVRQRPDGLFEFLGRLDRQVKLRGHRIELDEISAVVRRHRGVKEAVATLNVNGGYRHLAAHVVTTAEDSAKPEDVRSFLRATLPEYMVPTRMTFLESLPRLPNGKIDYRALSEPEPIEADTGEAAALPRDALERNLASIFEELLGSGPVNTRQSFFDLGGDSVLVARLLRRIEDTTGTRLPMATVFRAETIEQLACILRDSSGVLSPRGVIPIQADGAGPVFLCLGAGPSFLPLARLVGGGVRFTGLDLGLIDMTQLSRPCRLEDLAAHVAQRISELEPRGPYFLGGWCRYGPLAYETARQLSAQGEEIALLTLIDSQNPTYYQNLPAAAKCKMKIQRLAFHVDRVWSARATEMPAYVRSRLRVLRYRMHHTLAFSRRTEIEEMERTLRIASDEYAPPAYRGRVAVFQSTERPDGDYWDPACGWCDLVDGVLEVYEIPGDHESMLSEPHVQVFASRLRDCLRLRRYFEVEAG